MNALWGKRRTRADAGEIESVYNIGMYGTLFSMRFRLGFFQSVGRVENRILGLGATATTRGIGRRVSGEGGEMRE